jgi:hypothetical protein
MKIWGLTPPGTLWATLDLLRGLLYLLLLLPGVNPIAVKYIISYIILYYIISYIISYHTISYHIISYHISYIISYHISYPIIYHIISYLIVYHIIYIVSYHIISYIYQTEILAQQSALQIPQRAVPYPCVARWVSAQLVRVLGRN